MKTSTPQLYTVEETMEMLKIGRTTLWSLSADGVLKSVKIGARVLYRHQDIERFIARHTTRGAAR